MSVDRGPRREGERPSLAIVTSFAAVEIKRAILSETLTVLAFSVSPLIFYSDIQPLYIDSLRSLLKRAQETICFVCWP